MGMKQLSDMGVVYRLPIYDAKPGHPGQYIYASGDTWYKIWELDTDTGTNNYSFLQIKMRNRYYYGEWRVGISNNSSSSAPLINENRFQYSAVYSGYVSSFAHEMRIVKSTNVYTGFVQVRNSDIFNYYLADSNGQAVANLLYDPNYFTWWSTPVIETPGTGSTATEQKWL